MKHIIKAAVFVLLMCPGLIPQQFSPAGTEVVVPWSTSYYAGLGAGRLQFIDSLNGITANTQNGSFALTTDGGATWIEREPAPNLAKFLSIFLLAKDTLVAVRDSQYIFHSYNGGLSWQLKYEMGSSEHFSNCLFFNKKHGVIFPATGGIRITSDRGLTWFDLPWNFGPVKKVPSWSNGYLFVYEQTTSIPGIVFSTDNGISWKKIKLNLSGITRAERISNGFAVIGTDQKYYKLSDSGAVLASVISPNQKYNFDYCYISDTEVWALDNTGWAADNGYRYLTKMSFKDTAKTGYRLEITSNYINQIVPTTFDKLVLGQTAMSLDDGVLTFHKYNDKRIRVEYLKLPDNFEAKKLFFVNESFGFVATGSGEILKTTDGGLTWRKVNTPGIYSQINCFAARSENEFIASGNAGLILFSSDGGENWIRKESGFGRDITSISYSNPDNIYFCTSDSLYGTDHLWRQIRHIRVDVPAGRYTGVQFFDSLNGSVTYENEYFASHLLTSTNGGSFWWKKIMTYRLYTYDPANFGIYWKYSTGVTWYRNNTQGCIMSLKGMITGVHQNKNGVAAAYTDRGNFLITFGDKFNWSLVSLGEPVTVRHIFAAGNKAIYLAAPNGRIYKFSPSNLPNIPSLVLRQSPPDGAKFVPKNFELKWGEPYSHTPIRNYQVQIALGDTSNIVVDDASVFSPKYTLNLISDTSFYFWRVRARNGEGWGEFNPWYKFRTSAEILSFSTVQTNFTNNVTAAIKTPAGRYFVGTENGLISFTDNFSWLWTQGNSATTYKITKFTVNKYSSVIYAFSTNNEYSFSTNNGITWTKIADPLRGKMIYSLAFTGATTGYAAGGYGTIFKTTNGGSTWNNIWYSPDTGDNLDIKTIDSTVIIAVGAQGSFTISTDGGATFRQKSLAYSETFTRFEIDEGQRIIIRNSRGERRISNDLGNTWIYERLAFEAPLRGFKDWRNNSMMIDTLGGVFTMPFNSVEYFYQTLPEKRIANGLELVENEVLIPSSGGKLFVAPLPSPGSNAPWQYVVNPGAASLNQYLFTGAKSLMGAGRAGMVMVSEDEGRIWRAAPSPVTSDLFVITQKAGGEVVIAGDSGRVLVYNNGAFLAEGSGIPADKKASAISFNDKFTGFISCRDGSLFRTNDGGRTWIQKTEINPAAAGLEIAAIKAGKNKLYIHLESSVNNEATRSEIREYNLNLSGYRTIWSAGSLSNMPAIIVPGKFFAVLLQGNRIVTGRGPLMDTLVEFSNDTLNISSLFTSNGKNFWVGDNSGNLYRLDDNGGITSSFKGFALGSIKSVLFSHSGKGIVVSEAGNIYYGSSSDEIQPDDPSVDIPDEYTLYQNFPNPFNPSTTIGFQITTADSYTLEIFSSNGEKVQTLLNGFMEPGKYQIIFDASKLSSGLYFYRLRGNGAFFTKKMIYLK
ncbi:MAG: T9SS type A sorting domain-containing protein [Bacteroidetes bacterium]|nr:T9SS type A sorting domain-containing protein [Bacteroidota bacterium]